MTDKQLHKLSRRELLELLLEQRQELDRLQQELDETRAKLESRELKVEKIGSLAKASLEVTAVFEEAQKAANLYVENVKRIVTEEYVARQMRAVYEAKQTKAE